MRGRQRDIKRVGEKEKKAMTERKSQGKGGRWWVWEVIKDRNSSDLPPQRCQVRAGSGAVGGQYLAGSSLQQPAARSCQRHVCGRWEGDAAQVSLILQAQMLSGNCNTNGRLMNARHPAASCQVQQTHRGSR